MALTNAEKQARHRERRKDAKERRKQLVEELQIVLEQHEEEVDLAHARRLARLLREVV